MKAIKAITAIALTAGLIASAGAATHKRGTVNYSCQNGKKVSVTYTFNKYGVPLNAVAKLNGKTRTMAYDTFHSDKTRTMFKDKAGYNVNAGYLDVHNYGTSSGINIMSPKSVMLFKGCQPR